MGSRHPLDIFRSTDDGFDHASRRRRTVSGKVLGSNSRSSSDEGKAARGAGLLGAKLKSSSKAGKSSKSATRGPARAKPTSTRAKPAAKSGNKPGKTAKPKALFSPASSSAANVSRMLAYGAGVVVVVFFLVFAIQHTFVDDGGEVGGFPTLKSSEAEQLLGGVAAENLNVSTVLAATYPPTDHGLNTAWIAHDELASRGFESIEVAQIVGDDGAVEHYQLVVGRAAASTLGPLRDALQALDDWPAEPAAPFTRAQVIPHPLVPRDG